MEKAFVTGDIVQLKSGGPKMTIKDFNASFGYKCQWFAGSKLEEGYFPPDSLKVIKNEEDENDKSTNAKRRR